MKKSFLMLALLGGTATAAQAQSAISAGTISIGGSLGYSSNTSNSEYKSTSGSSGTSSTFTTEVTSNQSTFSPSVGYFIADNLAIGLSIGYTSTSSKTTFTGPGTTSPASLDAATTFRFGPYAQYYSMLSDQFGLVGTLGLGYQSSFTPTPKGGGGGGTSTVVETKGSGFYTALTPGVIFFPIPKFGISASIGGLDYNRTGIKNSDDKDGDAASQSSLGANFGLSQLQFGGTYYLGR